MSQNGLPIVDFLSHLFIVRQWGKKWISKKRFVSSPSVTKIKGCYPSLYRSRIGSHFVGINLVVWKKLLCHLHNWPFKQESVLQGVVFVDVNTSIVCWLVLFI